MCSIKPVTVIQIKWEIRPLVAACKVWAPLARSGCCRPWEEERTCVCRAAVGISNTAPRAPGPRAGAAQPNGQSTPVPRGQPSIVASHPQSAKQRQPTTRASLAKYSNVTFELLIIFPFWQPNKCYERVILSIHCTLRVNKHV